MRFLEIVKKEFLHDIDNVGLSLIILGIAMQFTAFAIQNAGMFALFSGLCGTILVVLHAQRKFNMFWFYYLQASLYLFVAIQNEFIGEAAEQVFYILTCFIGIFVWKKHYDIEKFEVQSEKLKPIVLIALVILTGFIFLSGWYYFKTIGCEYPLLDSLSTAPAFCAQILLVLRYREQWVFWVVINISSLVLWIIEGNYCMAAQFIFWIIISFYGIYKWYDLGKYFKK